MARCGAVRWGWLTPGRETLTGWDGPRPVFPGMVLPVGNGPAERPGAKHGGRSMEGLIAAMEWRDPSRERSAGRWRGGGVACEAATPEPPGA